MLEYGMESQAAFMLLTGEIGSGKTTLVRRLLGQLGDSIVVGLISNTHGNFKSIHSWSLAALGIQPRIDSAVGRYEALVNSFIRQYAKGRRTLLIFDEAQNLSMTALEELRLLSNVNSSKDLVVQILLVGQPELRDTLSLPKLLQFAQRISVDFHLRPLDLCESREYIGHRLRVAGGSPTLFQFDAIDFIYAQTQGVPRLLNQLCDLALVYAFAEGRAGVDLDLVKLVFQDRSDGKSARTPPSQQAPAPTAVSDDGMR
jgi:type II secretory pathway predicted ATPase ExeA